MAEVKSILKSSGDKFKNLRESGESLSGDGADPRLQELIINLITKVNNMEVSKSNSRALYR